MKSWLLRELAQRPTWMLLTASVLMLLPVFFHPTLPMPGKIYSVAFVVDVTQSMNVRDAAAGGMSRLALARAAVRDALHRLPCGSRASIGMFTERDVLMLFKPLEVCAHFTVLEESLNNVDWRNAWAADSFVAHGLYRGIAETKRIKASALVFITDGHQAPPANIKYLPEFDGKPGEVKGVIAGVGGSQPQPIPHLDEHEVVTGYWLPEDVMQFATFGVTDVKSVAEMEGYHGRNAPHGGNPEATAEHLSALQEDRLRLLAKHTGLEYLRLQNSEVLSSVLQHLPLQHQWLVTDVRPFFAGLVILLFVTSFFPPVVQRLAQRAFNKGIS